MRRINSYDQTAAIPKLGSRWVWEIDSPGAVALLEVTGVWWNGEEWWVRTRNMCASLQLVALGRDDEAINDLGRFAEAVTPVGLTRGAWMGYRSDRPLSFGQAVGEDVA